MAVPQERGRLSEAGREARNVGLVGAVIGIVGMIIEAPIAVPVFVASSALAASGEALRRVAQKPSSQKSHS